MADDGLTVTLFDVSARRESQHSRVKVKRVKEKKDKFVLKGKYTFGNYSKQINLKTDLVMSIGELLIV